MTDNRSESALTADKLQERIVYRSRVWQLWFLIGFLQWGLLLPFGEMLRPSMLSQALPLGSCSLFISASLRCFTNFTN